MSFSSKLGFGALPGSRIVSKANRGPRLSGAIHPPPPPPPPTPSSSSSRPRPSRYTAPGTATLTSSSPASRPRASQFTTPGKALPSSSSRPLPSRPLPSRHTAPGKATLSPSTKLTNSSFEEEMAARRAIREQRPRPWQHITRQPAKEPTQEAVSPASRVTRVTVARREPMREAPVARPAPKEPQTKLRFLNSRRRAMVKETAPEPKPVTSVEKPKLVSKASLVQPKTDCAPRRPALERAISSRKERSTVEEDLWVAAGRAPRLSQMPGRDHPISIKKRTRVSQAERPVTKIQKSSLKAAGTAGLQSRQPSGTKPKVAFADDIQVRVFSRYRFRDNMDLTHPNPKKWFEIGKITILCHGKEIGVWGQWTPEDSSEYGTYALMSKDKDGVQYYGEATFFRDGSNIGSLAPVDAWEPECGMTARLGDDRDWRKRNRLRDFTRSKPINCGCHDSRHDKKHRRSK